MKEVVRVKKHFTIGMAGHIDHGKTSLTKALTSIDTDRLKEERERQISIELGYAPLVLTDEMEVSIIDVPGHERFIRQMIAGVAGIDLVLFVVAADEGVMPQTKEHLDILSLLGIRRGVIVVTKASKVDEEMQELAEMDIRETIEGTFLEDQPLFFVDSLDGLGIDELKEGLKDELAKVEERNAGGAFRLPIDQVFAVHGQGTVVRGTVYEGMVREGDMLEVLPRREMVRTRQLQVHHQQRELGRAGQRVAINVGGIDKDALSRGDVLAAPGQYESTDTVDIALTTVDDLKHVIKQRQAIKLHIGTSEVYGKIVFFDRNELQVETEEVLCQLRLDAPVVTRRGDRFILRRPTPTETIGGGEVIDAHGERYRFGQETMEVLAKKRQGTPEELITDAILTHKVLTLKDLISHTGLQTETVQAVIAKEPFIQLPNQDVTNNQVVDMAKQVIKHDIESYHHEFPMRQGMPKAELIQANRQMFSKALLESVLTEEVSRDQLELKGPAIARRDYKPQPPEKWGKRVEHVLLQLKEEGFKVSPLEQHMDNQQLPAELKEEIIHYLKRESYIYLLDEKNAIHVVPFQEMVKALYEKTNEQFTLQEAKEITSLSRKYLVPFLEKLDQLNLTIRQEAERAWNKENVADWMSENR
nr:selenocysteine-specific translation elongation factor [Bacillus sp. FJAT-45037]